MGTRKNVRGGRRHAPATQAKPRGTDLVTASELIPGFCRSKSNVPTPGSLRTIKSPTAGIVSGIKSPPLARTPPPPHGIYIDRCIISFHPLPFIHVFGPFMLTLPLYVSVKSKLQHAPPRATPGAFDFFENYRSNSPLPGPKCRSNAPH